MELQTIVHLDPPAFRLDYHARLMLVGSCFVENIGGKLEYFRFDADINPCGIVYNPLSVADTLRLLLEQRAFTPDDLWHRDGLWGSFSHHGRFSAPDAGECLQKINTRLAHSARQLRETNLLVITFGTAWVFRHRQSGRVVSNCHKFPASEFERFRLEVGDIVEEYTRLLLRLQEECLGIRVLFTVSPIRHWKDGAHGNTLSKATLHLAIDRLMEKFAFVSYFPSYEIVMDELRDYRFYAADMLHISPQGVDYIWEKFRDLYFTPETLAVMRKVDKLNKTLAHRPTEPDSEATLRLRRQAEEELRLLFN